MADTPLPYNTPPGGVPVFQQCIAHSGFDERIKNVEQKARRNHGRLGELTNVITTVDRRVDKVEDLQNQMHQRLKIQESIEDERKKRTNALAFKMVAAGITAGGSFPLLEYIVRNLL